MRVDTTNTTQVSTCRWVTLSGPAQSGKDTLALVLVEDHGWTRVAFADPLKEMALAIDPWIDINWDMEVARLSVLVDLRS